MALVKRLHTFLLKAFLPVFAMTFFIVLFIVLMQFLWKYIDDLVGKGLELSVIAELFFYAAASMVPTALPLAILLASLMTFGNLGEKFELTAMKAAGISLVRAMMPLIVLVSGIAVGAFFFQNDVLPKAQVKMWTLLFSMRQKSPELEIPEKSFYDQIPGYSIYVDRKNPANGQLYNLMIYDVSKGYDNSTVLLADTAHLALTADGEHLHLVMRHGEQFDNLQQGNITMTSTRNKPFRRETFLEKEILIKFDNKFSRLDEGGMKKQYVGKNISELKHTMDSVQQRIDSVGSRYSTMLRSQAYAGVMPELDSASQQPEPLKQLTKAGDVYDLDSLYSALSVQQRKQLYQNTLSAVQQAKMDLQFKGEAMKDDYYSMRRHEIELIKKFTLSVACLLFFFIGAPLGAIIRKGGLGTPLVISVIIFIFYYIIDNTGYKLARDGKWVVWQGMWISTFILAPLGVYVTWKAMNDSAVFNPDAWRNFLRKALGVHHSRRVDYKELIINPISRSEALAQARDILQGARNILNRWKRPQLYFTYWFSGISRRVIGAYGRELDDKIHSLTDCTDKAVLNKLGDFPLVMSEWIYQPSGGHKWVSVVAMILFPLSVPVWIAGVIKQRYLLKDVRKCEATARAVVAMLDDEPSSAGPAQAEGAATAATEETDPSASGGNEPDTEEKPGENQSPEIKSRGAAL